MNLADEIINRLTRVEIKLDTLMQMPRKKEAYTTEEFAKLVDLAVFTVCKYTREGQIRAYRAQQRHGHFNSWRITHEELLRFRNEGPCPPGTFDNGRL